MARASQIRASSSMVSASNRAVIDGPRALEVVPQVDPGQRRVVVEDLERLAEDHLLGLGGVVHVGGGDRRDQVVQPHRQRAPAGCGWG